MMSAVTTKRDLITGNHFDRFRSKHPIYRYLMARYLTRAKELLAIACPMSVLEVGAGPGDLADRLFPPSDEGGDPGVSYCGTDICEEQVRIARRQYPRLHFEQASIYALPFEDGAFDLCLTYEVLEHLDDPPRALSEIARVTRRYILVSVPWEPIWRVLNMVRGAYLSDWGNTPGHVQHFSRREIRKLVSTRFEIIAERRPLPSTMLLGKNL